ncbi:MAG: Rrf2 family transcriptional regulator [Litoreibacter sp.]|uniref:RrF2 family transcriptional regulator n=1 Tax=Litoreibacter sp. TaxID=1969459 RepID=UPI003298C9B5
MKRKSRLSLALHTLAHMAADPQKVQTSAQIAGHAGTNPVVVRRVLGKLRDAGLLTAEKGHAGGWRLARKPELVSLADVYVALEESLVAASKKEDVPTCSLEHGLHTKVTSILEDVEQSLIARLAETSLSEINPV